MTAIPFPDRSGDSRAVRARDHFKDEAFPWKTSITPTIHADLLTGGWSGPRLALEKGIARRRDDPWICQAARFKRDHDNCREDMDWYTLADKYPDMTWAYDIAFNDNQGVGNPLRSEVEARILAREPFERIARRASTSPGVIEAFEAVFFHVTDRLDDEAFVIHQVLGPGIYQGFRADDYDLVWKLFGYRCGPVVLDVLVGVVGPAGRPEGPDEVRAALADLTRDGLRRQALLAVTTLRLNGFTAVEVVDKFLKQTELDRQAQGGGAGEVGEGLLANVSAMMTSLGSAFTVGRRPDNDPSPLAPFDGLKAELRANEMIARAAGRELPRAHEFLTLTFPEAPRRALESPADDA